jgi:hypothetical protein
VSTVIVEMGPSHWDGSKKTVRGHPDVEEASLRADYYPPTHEERLRVLDYVQRYGDREGHVRAVNLRQWLSQISNADSAVS